MEKNVKGQVHTSTGDLSLEEWLRIYVNQDVLKGDKQVNVTFGNGAGKKTIKEWEACFVFKPQAARGSNGVLLTELKGIGEIKDVLRTFDGVGF